MGLWSLESWFESRPRNQFCLFCRPQLTANRPRLFHRKPQNRRGVKRSARKQGSRRKSRVIRRIREMLRLQAERIALFVNLAALPVRGPVQKIPRVKLDARLRRQHFQDAPALRIARHSRQLNPRKSRLTIQNPVVIVPPPKFQLLVRSVDSLADRHRVREIKRRVFYIAKL